MADTAVQRRDHREAGLIAVAVMLALMWLSEIADAILSVNLDKYGIEPREADGLVGIVLAPFLHGGFGHLLGNTGPFLVMGALIALGGAARVLAVTAIVALVGGLGTWLFAPENTVHIGASGLVFGYAAYLIARGFFSRNILWLIVGAVVIFTFGFVLLGGLVPRSGVSWQGHVFGGIGGVVAARVLAARRTEKGSGALGDGVRSRLQRA